MTCCSTLTVPVSLSNACSFCFFSGCGNYGLVGTRGGHVFRYNMQSGKPRGSYPQSATPSEKTVKALTNVVKPGAIARITPDGFASKRIGEGYAIVVSYLLL